MIREGRRWQLALSEQALPTMAAVATVEMVPLPLRCYWSPVAYHKGIEYLRDSIDKEG
jgi:hypothetical protein